MVPTGQLVFRDIKTAQSHFLSNDYSKFHSVGSVPQMVPYSIVAFSCGGMLIIAAAILLFIDIFFRMRKLPQGQSIGIEEVMNAADAEAASNVAAEDDSSEPGPKDIIPTIFSTIQPVLTISSETNSSKPETKTIDETQPSETGHILITNAEIYCSKFEHSDVETKQSSETRPTEITRAEKNDINPGHSNIEPHGIKCSENNSLEPDSSSKSDFESLHSTADVKEVSAIRTKLSTETVSIHFEPDTTKTDQSDDKPLSEPLLGEITKTSTGETFKVSVRPELAADEKQIKMLLIWF